MPRTVRNELFRNPTTATAKIEILGWFDILSEEVLQPARAVSATQTIKGLCTKAIHDVRNEPGRVHIQVISRAISAAVFINSEKLFKEIFDICRGCFIPETFASAGLGIKHFSLPTYILM
jgi:hypothetical protein